MPTETQHLEQRVAALQSDLNTKDEQIDALTFSDNDRELSRRSWFDEAKRLEKEVEGLRSDVEKQRRLKMLVAEELQNALNNCSVYRVQLAERDALICDVLEAFKLEPDGSCINPGRDFIRPWAEKVAALSASADPAKSCGACGGCADGCKLDRESPPVERDEPSSPVSTTSDKYKAELYDEVWQLARDMGFGNVTDALMKLQSQIQGKKSRKEHICTPIAKTELS
ncbi:hypothetical protein SAMN05216178_2251 [Pseudomonas saponiphila]|uniref:Uncharacterized protein n=1 Tax=Pseudomonas saponiphila TaxID=556534 RepID=A0A1H4M757_9PSED|nr:hypothetical protein [Pseudomonas saponiphila]SEB78584.1 hypothetical protein SAMN05216178_2251 [Pseudomonas saponiphila]